MTYSEYQFFGYGTAPGQEDNMSETVSIFKGTYGEVWRTGDGYGTLGAGFLLCKEMAKEIEKLREQLAAAQKLAEVGAAIERAKRELPQNKEVEIAVDDSGSSVWVLLNAIGDYYDAAGDTLAEQINDAVRRAKEIG